MPKGKTPSLLSSGNGGISFEQSLRAGNCGRCKCNIQGGSKIGLLKHVAGGFSNKKRLCLACVEAIVVKTEQDLKQIRNGLL
jgi:hypothetical protein